MTFTGWPKLVIPGSVLVNPPNSKYYLMYSISYDQLVIERPSLDTCHLRHGYRGNVLLDIGRQDQFQILSNIRATKSTTARICIHTLYQRHHIQRYAAVLNKWRRNSEPRGTCKIRKHVFRWVRMYLKCNKVTATVSQTREIVCQSPRFTKGIANKDIPQQLDVTTDRYTNHRVKGKLRCIFVPLMVPFNVVCTESGIFHGENRGEMVRVTVMMIAVIQVPSLKACQIMSDSIKYKLKVRHYPFSENYN